MSLEVKKSVHEEKAEKKIGKKYEYKTIPHMYSRTS